VFFGPCRRGQCLGASADPYIGDQIAAGVTPISLLNPLIDAVDAALKRSPISNGQTLGGLVSHCYIDGKTMKDDGDFDGNGTAVIPVKILATV
jgi:hypothetical protein